jgi:hypothetical protein
VMLGSGEICVGLKDGKAEGVDHSVRQNVSPKGWHPPASLNGAKTQDSFIIIIIIIFTVVKTANLTHLTDLINIAGSFSCVWRFHVEIFC